MRAIIGLQAHWEAHYRIWVIDGTWHARRKRLDLGPVTAAGPAQLWEKLREDYAELASGESRFRELAPGPYARGGISSADMTSLTWLRMHYEEHYQIDYVQPGGQASFWRAVSRDDPPGTLVAGSAMSLRDMMREDQSRRRRGTFS